MKPWVSYYDTPRTLQRLLRCLLQQFWSVNQGIQPDHAFQNSETWALIRFAVERLKHIEIVYRYISIWFLLKWSQGWARGEPRSRAPLYLKGLWSLVNSLTACFSLDSWFHFNHMCNQYWWYRYTLYIYAYYREICYTKYCIYCKLVLYVTVVRF